MKMSDENFIIKTPCLLYCSGPSMSGKTTWLTRLLENVEKMFDKPIDRIIWCYGIDTGSFPEHHRIQLHEGPPDMEMLQGKDHKLLILDDLMSYYAKNKTELNNLFTRVAHHHNCSIINIVQSLFAQERTARANSTYVCLTKSTGDTLQIQNFARQIFPGRFNFFWESYLDAVTSHPYGYLMVDLHPTTREDRRLCTNIFDDSLTYYVEKKKP